MADRGDLRWEDSSFYTEDQVAYVLRSIGVDVQDETEAVFLAYCPFHGNRDTPSFAVNKTDGTYICFNPACNKVGNLMVLIKVIGHKNDFQAARLIAKAKAKAADDIVKMLETYAVESTDWKEYDPSYMARVKADMWKYAEPQLYMRGRDFEKQTLKDFEIGYDVNLDMVCVPMHDPMGKIEVGAVRRSVTGKSFKNTPGLPTSRTPFNVHRAKREGDAVVIVESSFDAMRLYQCGYPNVVALLGGIFNQRLADLLGKYFNTIVIMTDYDDKKKHVYKNCAKCRKENSLCKGHNPGEELGHKIADLMGSKRLMWAHHGGATRFPEGAKDPGDMDEETIRYAIKNAVSNFEYTLDS